MGERAKTTMTNPVPGYSITTPYGKKGSAWGCGWHDGADYAAPAGTDVVALWGGVVVEAAYPTSFGSAFGRAIVIDHDKLPDGSPGFWGLYAHLSAENVSVGQRVECGQTIGDIGTTGNSSGNHLHVGIYAQPSWCSGCGKNPQPWIDAEADVGIWTDYSGKPSGKLTIHSEDGYVKLDANTADPPHSGLEFHQMYAHCDIQWDSGTGDGDIRVKYVREDGDATGYQDYTVKRGAEDFLITAHHWERGESGLGGRWYINVGGGIVVATVTTRYQKIAVVK